MSTGTFPTSPRVLAALLLVAMMGVAGCDAPVASFPERLSGSTALPDSSQSVRERNGFAGHRSWMLNDDGLFFHDSATGKLVEVRIPDWLQIDEPFACPPDLAVGPDGEAVITSNVEPVLWRVDARTLAVSTHRLSLDADHHKDFGFSQLVYSAKHGAYFAVNGVHGSLWRIDLSLREGRKIGQHVPVGDRCSVTLSRSAE